MESAAPLHCVFPFRCAPPPSICTVGAFYALMLASNSYLRGLQETVVC